ncbi:hypothetical protein BD560DRAFT_416677 [Blakeslea trispora]|nr:hypothetical protein BD560DRAFT_416677 [Blakeslea trispora]
MFHTVENARTFDFKRSADSSAQITANEGFPPPTTKSVSMHFHAPTNENQGEPESSFFCQSKPIYHLYNYNNKNSYPAILSCKMDRGFFVSQSHWTCYRRNYFQVTASAIIPEHTEQDSYGIQLNPDKPMQPIREFAVQIKAYTTNTASSSTHSLPSPSDTHTTFESHHTVKPITLTQMTAKRDKGPQREPPSITIIPSDTAFNCEQFRVTFERLQFRVATANNGKRRASQQYFRLAFQLLACLEDGTQQVISECCSSPLVVRGRSPGHYSTEPQRDLKRKRKTSPASLPAPLTRKPSSPSHTNKIKDILPSPTHSTGPNEPARHVSEGMPSSSTEGSSPSPHYSHSATLPPPPPPPQYIYTPPSMVLDARQSDTTEPAHSPQQQQQQPPTSQPAPPLIPASMVNSAFSHLHARSQSANDSDFFARQRQNMKYASVHQENGLFEYNVGMQNAFRNWQQQMVRQRTDSATTFDSSYMSSSTASHQEQGRPGTRPGTPLPYQHTMFQHSPNPMANNWSPRQSHFMEDSKMNHHPQQNGYVNSQEDSTKLYHSPSR